ncbi:methyltransferase domain-containing protein [Geranomyces variabilis]|nr:methyltransferase domain-containing protein [Geranomyces variabilis]
MSTWGQERRRRDWKARPSLRGSFAAVENGGYSGWVLKTEQTLFLFSLQHEVQLLAALIDHLASQSNITNIMDIGAGQGYLDACLAYTYQHTVIGVDDDEIQTCGAKRRSELIEKIFSSSKNRGKAVGKVFHINRRVGSGESFETLWLLCGLHACGDLSPALMRHFLNSDAKVLASVGCCYNHLSESAPLATSIPPDPSLPTPTIRAPPPRTITSTPRPRGGITTHSAGFPLSTHLNTRDCTLGFTARMAACQATCRWTDDPLASIQSFKRHHYRALLQKLIIEHKLMPNLDDDDDDDDEATRTITVGKIPRGAFEKGFATYARAALVKLGADVDDGDDDGGGGEKAATVVATDPAALAQYEREHESREKEIAVVWTLRAMLAEALESLILVDRFLALVESGGETDVCIQDVVSPSTGIFSHLTQSVDGDSLNGTPNRAALQVALFPLFDHVSSPRNMVLICRKQT